MTRDVVRSESISISLLLRITPVQYNIHVREGEFTDNGMEVTLVKRLVKHGPTAVGSHQVAKLAHSSPNLQNSVLGSGGQDLSVNHKLVVIKTVNCVLEKLRLQTE